MVTVVKIIVDIALGDVRMQKNVIVLNLEVKSQLTKVCKTWLEKHYDTDISPIVELFLDRLESPVCVKGTGVPLVKADYRVFGIIETVIGDVLGDTEISNFLKFYIAYAIPIEEPKCESPNTSARQD